MIRLLRHLGLGGMLWALVAAVAGWIAFDETLKRATWDKVDVFVAAVETTPEAKRDAAVTLHWARADGSFAERSGTRKQLGRDFRHVAQGETLSALANPANPDELDVPMLFGTLYLFGGIIFFGVWRLFPFGATSVLGRTEFDMWDPHALSVDEKMRGLTQLSLKMVVLGIYGVGFGILGDAHRNHMLDTFVETQAQVASVDRQCVLEWTSGFYPNRTTHTSARMDCADATREAARPDQAIRTILPDLRYDLAYVHPRGGAQTKTVFQSFFGEDEEPAAGTTVSILMHPFRATTPKNSELRKRGTTWGMLLGSLAWSACWAMLVWFSLSREKPSRPTRRNPTRGVRRSAQPRLRRAPQPR